MLIARKIRGLLGNNNYLKVRGETWNIERMWRSAAVTGFGLNAFSDLSSFSSNIFPVLIAEEVHKSSFSFMKLMKFKEPTLIYCQTMSVSSIQQEMLLSTCLL